MTITYILQLGWILIFAFMVITTFVFTTFWGLCSNERVKNLEQCIDFSQFSKYIKNFFLYFFTIKFKSIYEFFRFHVSE